MVQHFFVLIGECHIIELYFRLSRLRLIWYMLFARIRKFWFLQYSFNTIQSRIHHGQAGCLAIERLERTEQVKNEQEDAQHIGQRERTALFQNNR